VALFTVGFVMIAALYAATASLVSRVEDLGSATSPIMMLVMIPYFLVIFFNNNPTVLAVMSYVPFSAPVAVPMRIFIGTSAWWESLLSLAVLVLAMVLAIRVAALIYERSLLRTGARVKLGDVLRSGSCPPRAGPHLPARPRSGRARGARPVGRDRPPALAGGGE